MNDMNTLGDLDNLTMDEYFEKLQKEEGISFITDEGKAELGYKDKMSIEQKLDQYVSSLDKDLMAKINDPTTQSIIQSDIETIIQEEKQRLGLGKMFEDELKHIGKKVCDRLFGYGPIQTLVDDPEISEIMVNSYGKGNIYFNKNGKLEVSTTYFATEEQLRNVITSIVSSVDREVNDSSPIVDARLKDGSRVNVTLPPVALKGPCLTIRKFHHNLEIADLIKNSTMTKDTALFLKYSILAKLNIFLFGGTDSGKTTLLNVLSSFIPEHERIVTIEDSAELKLRQPHVISFEARPANVEGNKQITLRDLIKNSLRLRPDRIVVGEVRGGEALDMLQAMNTGHDGSLTTGHANNPSSLVARLETMALMSGMDLPVKAIRQQIAEAIDMVVGIQKFSDKKDNYRQKRRITSIASIDGVAEDGKVIITPIFQYDKDTDSMYYTGNVPYFADRFEEHGFSFSSLK